MTENKIRPGIRARVGDISGITGIPYGTSIAFQPDGNGRFRIEETSKLTPLPFRAGDRVHWLASDGIHPATVIAHDSPKGHTAIFVDDFDRYLFAYTGNLTLIDYPGKEAE